MEVVWLLNCVNLLTGTATEGAGTLPSADRPLHQPLHNPDTKRDQRPPGLTVGVGAAPEVQRRPPESDRESLHTECPERDGDADGHTGHGPAQLLRFLEQQPELHRSR